MFTNVWQNNHKPKALAFNFNELSNLILVLLRTSSHCTRVIS